jgi:hypothetical protein
MPTPERLREQSLRLCGPVVTYKASVADTHNQHSQTRVAFKVHRAGTNDAVAQTAVQFALPPRNGNRKWLPVRRVANAERTDKPQHLAPTGYRVLIERAKQEDKEQAF